MVAAFEPGTVLQYPYLWHWQDAQGETEGRKDRPVAVAVLFVARDGQEYVLLLPLTTREPARGREAVEIPATEKPRAALDQKRRQWLMLDEYNLDPVKGSYYLRQSAVTGQFSRAFMQTVLERFRSLFSHARRVARHP
ncbi:hypothetical protein [Gluconobacter oxydans]|uniref:hypothetical protein n=1 Tax=Gluconobacter oxydans TaxID=442 RepID=UPI0039EB1BB9